MLRRTVRFALAPLFAALALGFAPPAFAGVIAYLTPPSQVQTQGASFQVAVYADFTAPAGSTGLLGFGLDLAYDANLITLSAPPQMGPGFTAFSGPDGDGFGGIAAEALASGTLLLATLSFHADAPGTSALVLGITAGDLTEGFALDPTGFDTVSFVDAQVTVVPEPASLLLLGSALAGIGVRRRCARRSASARGR